MIRAEFQIFSQGISDTKSLYRLIDKLSAIASELYHGKEGAITAKISGLSPSLAAVFAYLEQKGLEPQGDSNQKAFIEDIIKYLKEIRKVGLTLAFEPDESFKSRLNDEVSNQAKQKVVLDITLNHHIIAGAVLEFAGKYKDYSLESKLNKFLKEVTAEVLEQEVQISQKSEQAKL